MILSVWKCGQTQSFVSDILIKVSWLMPLKSRIIVPVNISLCKPAASAVLSEDDHDETSCVRS